LFISAKVKPVASYNEKAINKLPGKLFVSRATHIQAMTKSYKPRVDKITGRIGDTQYVDELNLKNRARVMLIFNIDVSDLLCNGATGTVLGIEVNEKASIRAVIVKFDNPAAGQESRRRNPMMTLKYPGGTVIKKKEQDYSLARNKGLISSTAKLIQFPIVLAWAVTVHKFQGQTVKQPQKVVIDLSI
jgi:ATP-dependent exoDNAse (exonuclease V) alpha subunit